MPKISISVPVYNAEKVIHYCIESILQQSFEDFELILVDDGSVDNSGKICDEYALKDSRIRVIHKENGGVSSARNTGIQNSTGEFICFVDSDDFIEKDYLELLLDSKRKYPDYDNIWCGFQTVTDYCRANKKEIIATDSEKVSFFNTVEIMTLHEKWLDASPCNKLYSRQLISENKLSFLRDLSLGEDLLFNLEYLDCSNGKILTVNQPLYNYLRDGKQSLDNKYYPDFFDIYKRINGEMYKYAVKWKLSEEQLKKLYNAEFYKYELVLRNTMKKENKSGFVKKLKYNKFVMKTDEFRNSLLNGDCYINKYYKKAYLSANALGVFLLDIVCRLLK